MTLRLAIALALLAASAPAQTNRYNVVTAPECVASNGYISAIVTPGTLDIIGEPGAVFPPLASNEAPYRLVTILNGRVNSGGVVDWDYYNNEGSLHSRYYARVYSANPTNGYLPPANSAPIEFQLAHPVDSNSTEVTTIQGGPGGLSTLPDLPAFSVISASNTNELEKYGYWMGFRLTTDTGAVNATTAIIPTNALALMRSDPDGFVLTFHVKSIYTVAGGVRIGIQEAGYGQGQLRQGVFSSDSQARGYVGNPSVASYALGLETITLEPPAAQNNVPVLIRLANPWAAQAELTATNFLAGQTNTVASLTDLTGTWQTATVFIATAETHTVQVPATNPAAYYRIEHAP